MNNFLQFEQGSSVRQCLTRFNIVFKYKYGLIEITIDVRSLINRTVWTLIGYTQLPPDALCKVTYVTREVFLRLKTRSLVARG